MIENLRNKTVLGLIKELKTLWNHQLIPHLQTLNIIPGKGISVRKYPTGIIISATASGMAAYRGNIECPGSFSVSYDAEKMSLNVGKGFINCNGFCSVYDGGTIIPENGLLCLHASKNGTAWEYSLKFGSFTKDMFPVAEIELDGDNIRIIQYPIAVAQFVISKVCPLAKAGAQ